MSLLGKNGPGGAERNGIKSPVMCSRYWVSFLCSGAPQRRAATARVIKLALRVLHLPSHVSVLGKEAAAALVLQTPHVLLPRARLMGRQRYIQHSSSPLSLLICYNYPPEGR